MGVRSVRTSCATSPPVVRVSSFVWNESVNEKVI